jgi:hypothetical protein
MSDPYEVGPTTRRSYEEKHQLVLDLVMLLFGGLFRLLKRRSQ